MKALLLSTVAAVVLGVGTAQAGIIVHDTPGEFTSIQAVQGKDRNGRAVPNSRSNPNAIFGDGFYSLGLGNGTKYFDPLNPGSGPTDGYLSLSIDPLRDIASGTLIEITTKAQSGHDEALLVFLGTAEGMFGMFLGTFVNNAATSGNNNPMAFAHDTSKAQLSAAYDGTAGGSFQFAITLNAGLGPFHTITFADASYTGSYADGLSGINSDFRDSQDGFDLDGVSVTSVPEPGTLALLGAGLAGLGLARRRKAA